MGIYMHVEAQVKVKACLLISPFSLGCIW